jgi:hypothetical protein
MLGGDAEDASGGAAYEDRPSIAFEVRTYDTDEETISTAEGAEDL